MTSQLLARLIFPLDKTLLRIYNSINGELRY
jgi:hypothetical protein